MFNNSLPTGSVRIIVGNPPGSYGPARQFDCDRARRQLRGVRFVCRRDSQERLVTPVLDS